MLGRRVNWKPCSNISSKSGFRPQKLSFGTFMVCLCGPTTIWKFLQLILDEQGKTETVVRQIDDGYTHGRGSVRRSAAYGVQQRRVAALTGRLVRNEIGVEYFLSAISYHTPEPLRL
ncbi:hypothetical protein T08_5430 [Trichinella sp. T8]|nr:hypothetical protein T08_5430 [Trichinella sp. T8]